MKKNFFFMAALLVAMTGCNKEPQMENNGISSDDKVYMSFSIQTLTTRSATDSEGETNSNATPDYEVGLDKENTISSVDVVLRNANSYVCATVTNPTQEETIRPGSQSSTALCLPQTLTTRYISMPTAQQNRTFTQLQMLLSMI